jgi:ATP-dependent Clp protease protease subunit
MASDIEIQATEILKTRSRLNRIYQHHTGMEMKIIENVMDRDTYMTPEDAKAFGVIDDILTTREGSGKKMADVSAMHQKFH